MRKFRALEARDGVAAFGGRSVQADEVFDVADEHADALAEQPYFEDITPAAPAKKED